MPFDGNGNYVLPTPSYPAIGGATISSTYRNTIDSDLQTALSNCVTRDGQSPVTANQPMAGFKHTGLGAGTVAGDSVRYEQIVGLPRARASVAGQVISDSTLTTLLFATIDYNVATNYVAATGKFTATIAGYYRVSAAFQFSAIAGASWTPAIYKNGASRLSFLSTAISETLDDEVYLAVADYLEIKVTQTSGSNKSFTGAMAINYSGA